MNYIEIIQQPESRILEFKSKLLANRQSLLKTIIGFANGSGGSIYIGVRDDRTVCGIKEEPFEFEKNFPVTYMIQFLRFLMSFIKLVPHTNLWVHLWQLPE